MLRIRLALTMLIYVLIHILDKKSFQFHININEWTLGTSTTSTTHRVRYILIGHLQPSPPIFVIAHSIGEGRSKHLQALRVVRVHDSASESTGTGSRTSPSLATTLTPVRSNSSSSRSAGSRSRGLGGRGSRAHGSRGFGGRGGSRASGRTSATESRVERTNLNVRVDDIGATGLGFKGLGVTRGCSAGATSSARGTSCVCGVSAVEPEHVDIVVVPQAHDQNHTS